MKLNLHKLTEEFHFNGFLTGRVTDPALTKYLSEFLLGLDTGTDSVLSYKEVYPGQLDIIQDVCREDDLFIDLVTKTGLLQLLRFVTSQDLIVSDVRVRKVVKSKGKIFGYQPPHRDAYAMGREWIGPRLPNYKLIFYPRLKGASYPKLKIYPGTHRKMPRIKNGMLSGIIRSFIDRAHVIESSDSGFCFFNGNVLHSPLKEKSSQSGIRIIYVFQDGRNENISRDLNELFNTPSNFDLGAFDPSLLNMDANEIFF